MNNKRNKTEIYAKMLTLQADMAFPFERHLYETEEWYQSVNILDFGCGNGEYLKKLASLFPEKSYIGVEADEKMLSIARANVSEFRNIKIVLPDKLNSIDVKFEFFIFRLVLLHLPSRKTAFDLTKNFGRKECSVLVIDADDDYFLYRPEPKHFLQALGSLRKKSIDRNLISKVNNELAEYGFTSCHEFRIVINNTFPHIGDNMTKYMYYTAEMGVGNPLPANVHNDLTEWWLNNNAYIQYGMFSKFFTKK